MTKEFLYNFITRQNLAVVSTLSKELKPESALVGFAVSKDLEIVFDTIKTSRKYKNLILNPSVAVVIGWDNETTVQYEGIASELDGIKGKRLKEVYFEVFPDGHDRAKHWPGLVHIKITPGWIRYSSFIEPVIIEEMTAPF
jgi:general stress protein 26